MRFLVVFRNEGVVIGKINKYTDDVEYNITKRKIIFDLLMYGLTNRNKTVMSSCTNGKNIY